MHPYILRIHTTQNQHTKKVKPGLITSYEYDIRAWKWSGTILAHYTLCRWVIEKKDANKIQYNNNRNRKKLLIKMQRNVKPGLISVTRWWRGVVVASLV